jgi:hypothetical protein
VASYPRPKWESSTAEGGVLALTTMCALG